MLRMDRAAHITDTVIVVASRTRSTATVTVTFPRAMRMRTSGRPRSRAVRRRLGNRSTDDPHREPPAVLTAERGER